MIASLYIPFFFSRLLVHNIVIYGGISARSVNVRSNVRLMACRLLFHPFFSPCGCCFLLHFFCPSPQFPPNVRAWFTRRVRFILTARTPEEIVCVCVCVKARSRRDWCVSAEQFRRAEHTSIIAHSCTWCPRCNGEGFHIMMVRDLCYFG